jgi:glucose/arabinose dehydrogenase
MRDFIQPRRSAAPLFLGLAAVFACTDEPAGPIFTREAGDAHGRPKSASAAAVTCDADNGGLTLPPGFCAVVVVKGVGRARHMAVRPNGDLYVAINNSPPSVTPPVTGGVLALRDTDGDARADLQQMFGPTGGNGIAWHDGRLFFAPNDRVLRWNLSGSELVPSTGAIDVVTGLPADGDHVSKTIVLDRTGGVFVNIGSASNSCQVENRVAFSPGVDPCPELPVRSGVWRYLHSAVGQTHSPQQRFASELRNMVALAIDPASGVLYGAQNGRDQLFENWPNLFTATDDALLPAEELFRIDRGRFGWPYCYFDAQQDKKVLAPEYGGDGTVQSFCGDRRRPVDTYPAHWAPLSMLFYTGAQFPERYKGGLFIAFHGSRFDPSQQPAGPGYVVTFIRWQNGGPVGEYETFAGNFAGGNPTPEGAAHRPVGLAQAPDGSLYISDDKAGWVWRVFYVGQGQ